MESIISCKLQKLIVYPIKSCAGMEVSSWLINKNGLKFDRFWCIVNQNKKKFTSKRYLILSLIYPNIDLELTYLSLRYQDEVISIPLQDLNNIDYNPVNKWLSLIVGEDCYLISKEKTDKNFSYRSNIHLINQRSIKDLQSKILFKEISYHNFRPNLVVDLTSLDNEDEIVEYLINDCLKFRLVEKCKRCSVINIQNGIIDSNIVYDTIFGCSVQQKSCYFGILVTLDNSIDLNTYLEIKTGE